MLHLRFVTTYPREAVVYKGGTGYLPLVLIQRFCDGIQSWFPLTHRLLVCSDVVTSVFVVT